MTKTSTLHLNDGNTIAYHALDGKLPGVIFMGGFKSDMCGTKAISLEEHCNKTNRAFIRFDYFGHGQSSGKFEDGTIGQWKDDAIAIIDRLTDGPQIIVGSSMGGWIMFLAAIARPLNVVGLVGIAPAPDFTQNFLWDPLDDADRRIAQREGYYYTNSEYDNEPLVITMNLIEEGRKHLLLKQPLNLKCPLRIIHGMKDTAVPWQHSVSLIDSFEGNDVEITYIKDGDHRLSEPSNISRIIKVLEELISTF